MVVSLIFAILGLFLHPLSLFSFGLGLIAFVGLPIVSKLTGWKQPAHFLFWLAKKPLNRMAIVVSEHNDILFKQMSFNARGVEQITLDGVKKDFEDPDSALHYWLGVPFALADETAGVLFDPRHAALGKRKHSHEQREQYSFPATEKEWESYGVSKWIRGVYEFPTNYELVNLSMVRSLVDGGERSEYPHRTEELYKHSRDPFGEGAGIAKFFYPILAFAVIFGGIWFMASQFGTPQGSGSTVSFSLLALVAVPTRAKKGLGALAVIAVLLGYAFFVYLIGGPLVLIAASIALVTGFTMLPAFAILFKASNTIAGFFSSSFFRLGFLGYNRPVFVWTPQAYRLREYSELDSDTPDPTWYGLFGSLVGFTFEPQSESWDAEVIKNDDLEAQQIADDSTDTKLPKGVARTNIIRDRMGAFVPERVKSSAYYLDSKIAQARFKNSASGEKSLKRLLEAKEKHGEGAGGLDDRAVLYLTAAGGFVGMCLGVFFFLL